MIDYDQADTFVATASNINTRYWNNPVVLFCTRNNINEYMRDYCDGKAPKNLVVWACESTGDAFDWIEEVKNGTEHL